MEQEACIAKWSTVESSGSLYDSDGKYTFKRLPLEPCQLQQLTLVRRCGRRLSTEKNDYFTVADENAFITVDNHTSGAGGWIDSIIENIILSAKRTRYIHEFRNMS